MTCLLPVGFEGDYHKFWLRIDSRPRLRDLTNSDGNDDVQSQIRRAPAISRGCFHIHYSFFISHLVFEQ
jgi:hypothetical protein